MSRQNRWHLVVACLAYKYTNSLTWESCENGEKKPVPLWNLVEVLRLRQQPNLFGFSRFDRLTVSSMVRLELLTVSRITRSHKISVNFDTRDSGHTHLTPGTLWIMSFEIPLLFRLRFEHVKFKSKRLCALLTRSATFFKRKYFETYLFLRVALSNVVILINSYVNIYRSSFYIYLWPFTVLFYVLHTAQPPI